MQRTYNREKENLMYKDIFRVCYVVCGFCKKEVKYFLGMERRDFSIDIVMLTNMVRNYVCYETESAKELWTEAA